MVTAAAAGAAVVAELEAAVVGDVPPPELLHAARPPDAAATTSNGTRGRVQLTMTGVRRTTATGLSAYSALGGPAQGRGLRHAVASPRPGGHRPSRAQHRHGG